MIRVSIVGSTGYTGSELLRYLIRHPEVTLAHLTSESFAGQPISQIHKFLKGRSGLICEKLSVAAVAKDSDIVFLGLPHGAAAKTAAEFLNKGVKVIDLSAGLPLYVGNLLGKGPMILDAKSGISGAGRKVEAMYLFSEQDESMQAYALKGHRHQPEITQEWNKANKAPNELIFVPQLVPMNRGIFANLYAPLKKKMTAEALRDLYLSYYMREPFVSILGTYESPEIKAVSCTNNCQIGISVSASGTEAIITAALDNLVKGASGQAIQNMNLMFGLDETMGLL